MWVPRCRKIWRRRWPWPNIERFITVEIGPSLVGKRKGLKNTKNKTKMGLLQLCRATRGRKLCKWFIPRKKIRERVRDARCKRKRVTKKGTLGGNASIVVEVIPWGTARSGRRWDINSTLWETSWLLPFAHMDGFLRWGPLFCWWSNRGRWCWGIALEHRTKKGM